MVTKDDWKRLSDILYELCPQLGCIDLRNAPTSENHEADSTVFEKSNVVSDLNIVDWLLEN